MTVMEIPRVLPVRHLSVSSIKTYLDCPERWRRRYILGEYEPSGGKMIAGKAAGAAEGANFQQKIETTEDLSVDDVLDTFSDEWQLAVDTIEVDWADDKPGEIKDTAAEALKRYHIDIAPAVNPVSVEREFRLRLPGAEWDIVGYIDFEDVDTSVNDFKMSGKSISTRDAAVDLQASTYLAARRAEGNPASEFRFHLMNRGVKQPYAKVIPTERTDAQLDGVLQRYVLIANEIVWRAENEVWQGAIPGHWVCAEKWCGFWHSCPMGGGLR